MSTLKNNPNGNDLVLKDISQLGSAVRSKRKQDGLAQQDLAAIPIISMASLSK